MTDLAPGIIATEFNDIAQKIGQIEGLTDWVHLDVMDGSLVRRNTWSAPEDLKQIGGKTKIEAHLMIAQPEEILLGWLENVDRVIVHTEATNKIPEIADAIKNTHCQLALALMLNTPIEAVYSYLEDDSLKINTVLLMSIAQIGYSGELFDEKVLAKIKDLRTEFPNVTIKVDGGVNLSTGKLSVEAGANSLVANSAIWNSGDIKKIIEEFQKL